MGELKFHLYNIYTKMISVLVCAVIFIFSSLDLTSADSADNNLGQCACQKETEKVSKDGVRYLATPPMALVDFTTDGRENGGFEGLLLTPYSIMTFTDTVCNLLPNQDACKEKKAFNADRFIRGDTIKGSIELKLSDGSLIKSDQIDRIMIPQSYIHKLPETITMAIIKMKEKMY